MRTLCVAIFGLICMLNVAQSQVVLPSGEQPTALSVAVENLPAYPVGSLPATTPQVAPVPQPISECVATGSESVATGVAPCHRGTCCSCRAGHGHHGRCRIPDYWGSSAFYHMPPLGASVRSAMLAHIEEGHAAKLVLYRFDFGHEDTQVAEHLNRYGVERLRKLAPLIAESGRTLIVEPSRTSQDLDQARRAHVIQELGQLMGGEVPQEQVVVASPPTRGASGLEAILHTTNRLRRVAEEEVIEPSPGSFRPSTY